MNLPLHPSDCVACRGRASDGSHRYRPASLSWDPSSGSLSPQERAGTARGRSLPPPRGIPRLPVAERNPVQGDVNPRLTDHDIVPGLHAVGRPQHLEPGRGLPLRVTYAALGAALLCVAVYLLAGHWFGQPGKAAVVWLLHTAALLVLGGGGLALFAAAVPADRREDSDG